MTPGWVATPLTMPMVYAVKSGGDTFRFSMPASAYSVTFPTTALVEKV